MSDNTSIRNNPKIDQKVITENPFPIIGQAPGGHHRVVIVGGGFAGLYAARSLKRARVSITIIDRRNFHLFQPLLYQVATGELSPGDIASPLRAVFRHNKNITVVKDEVVDIEPGQGYIATSTGQIPYDTLILAPGSQHHYFGHDEWEKSAPGLKTIEDALEIRKRIFENFELAEQEKNPDKRRRHLTFVVIGGGPTGVELTGTMGELALKTLRGEFRSFDTIQVRIILIEGNRRILPTYPEKLAGKAHKTLTKLGVTIKTGCLVTSIENDLIKIKSGDDAETISAGTILWAAGIRPSALGKIISQKTGTELDHLGRIMVAPDLSLPGYPSIFVIGDLAHFSHGRHEPLPGIAPVAMQQGRYVAGLIKRRLKGGKIRPFHYSNRGNLAVIGRNAAIADFGHIRFSGFIAWLIWVFVHIGYLIEFDNKLLVMIQWGWNYFTRKRGARLITERK
nr:NAD(P)/FAD-dependent oxidoreductase [candidate division Zixibacteria bacterium]